MTAAKALCAGDAWKDHRARIVSKRKGGGPRRQDARRIAEDGAELLPTAGSRDDGDFEDEITYAWISSLLSARVSSTNTYSTLRVARFACGYFGKSAEASSGLIITLNFWRSPRFYAMKAAGNALGLLYASTWIRDPRVLLEARKAMSLPPTCCVKRLRDPMSTSWPFLVSPFFFDLLNNG